MLSQLEPQEPWAELSASGCARSSRFKGELSDGSGSERFTVEVVQSERGCTLVIEATDSSDLRVGSSFILWRALSDPHTVGVVCGDGSDSSLLDWESYFFGEMGVMGQVDTVPKPHLFLWRRAQTDGRRSVVSIPEGSPFRALTAGVHFQAVGDGFIPLAWTEKVDSSGPCAREIAT